MIKSMDKKWITEMLPNYRGLTISSVVYKTLVRIMENQVMGYVEDKVLLGNAKELSKDTADMKTVLL